VKYVIRVCSAVLCLVLSACGGSGGSTLPNTIASTALKDSLPVINPTISGQLFFVENSYVTELDIKTGLETRSFISQNATPPAESESSTPNLVKLFTVGKQVLLDRSHADAKTYQQWIPYNSVEASADSQLFIEQGIKTDCEPICITPKATGELQLVDKAQRVIRSLTEFDVAQFMPNGDLALIKNDSIYRLGIDDFQPRLIKKFTQEIAIENEFKSGNVDVVGSNYAERVKRLLISPNGDNIAFVTKDKRAVWVMTANGNNLKQLTMPINSKSDNGFSWELALEAFSPDGQSVLISTKEAIDFYGFKQRRFFIVPLPTVNAIDLDNAPEQTRMKFIDKRTGKVVYQAPSSVASWKDLPTRAEFTFPLGTTIAGDGVNRGLKGAYFDDQIRKIDLESGKASYVPLRFSGYRVIGISPLGDYALKTEGYPSALYATFASDGTLSAENCLPSLGCSELGFSPNKQQLSCLSYDYGYDGKFIQYSLKIYSADLKAEIKNISNVASARWLPDGGLVYTSYEKLGVFFLNQAFLASKEIANFSVWATVLSVSASGSKLLLWLDGQVWIMNIDGSGLRQLTNAASEIAGAVFSPNEKIVLVSGLNYDEAEPAGQVWAVPVDGVRVPIFNTLIKSTSAFPIQMLANDKLISVPFSSHMVWQ
jgi:hypothetical protein